MTLWLREKLWGLCEHADWNSWPPRKFWRRALRWFDRRAGYG